MSPPIGQRWRLLSYRHMAATTLRLLSRWSSSLAVAHLRCRLALWLPSTSSSSIPFPLVTPWRTSSSTSSRVTTPPPTPPSTLMLGKSRDEERYAPSMAWLDPHRNAVFRHPLWVSANCPQSLRGKRIRCRDRRQGRFVLSRSQVSIADLATSTGPHAWCHVGHWDGPDQSESLEGHHSRRSGPGLPQHRHRPA